MDFAQESKKFFVIGAGPNGLYVALKILLQVDKSTVVVVEKRKNNTSRPQVARFPVSVVLALPAQIQESLFPDATIRNTILGQRKKTDQGFWPRAEYQYFPWVTIQEFQRHILTYIMKHFDSERFQYIHEADFNFTRFNVTSFDAVFVAAGKSAITEEIRQIMGINFITTDDTVRCSVDRLGIYLVYNLTEKEDYQRGRTWIKGAECAAKGFTYAHSNDAENHVQIYTYPVDSLREIYAKMPGSFQKTAAFSISNPLTLDGKKCGVECLTEEEKTWFQSYSTRIKYLLKSFKVPLPSNDSQVKVFFAPRFEYYYNQAAAFYKDVPIFFTGDSVAGTDYKYGLSLGRGLIATMALFKRITEIRTSEMYDLVAWYNKYWNEVIETEFGKNNPQLTREPHIVYKYIMEGRIVNGKPLHKETFLNEIQIFDVAMKEVEDSKKLRKPSFIEEFEQLDTTTDRLEREA